MVSLQDTFDESSRVLIEMSEQREEIKKKYGESSKLYHKLLEQSNSLIRMQLLAADEITHLRQSLHLAQINLKAKDIIINSLESRVPIQRLLELYEA